MATQILIIYQDEQPDVFIIDVDKITHQEVLNAIAEARNDRNSVASLRYGFETEDDDIISVQQILYDAQVNLPVEVTEKLTLYTD